VAVVIVAGLMSVGPTGASVAASVKTFLYDWENGDYAGAAALTTGKQAVVKKALKAAFRQLGAEDLELGMGPIITGASTSTAYFNATVDLGSGALPWQYQGHFRLRRVGSGWLVVWSPSVIAPGLGPHDRLAVITITHGRASPLDSVGQPLIPLSPAYEVGVWPYQVTHPAATAAALARATGLVASDADQMRELIEASPPHALLNLIQLSPARYRQIRDKLREIDGVEVNRAFRRLFASNVRDVTGQIGTETATVLAKEGEPYRPGTTVGESGLEQEYQAQLAGTPTTEVVVQDRAGKQVRMLHRWPGRRGTAVRTTIDGGIQSAAQRALAGLTGSTAAIVATRAGGGQILAVASGGRAGRLPAIDPLYGRYQPAQTFTMVSTAAALSWIPGFAVSSPLPCKPTNPIGGQTFSNRPGQAKLGRTPRFSADFMHACVTAFAGLSLQVTSPALMKAAKGFGIGGPPWRLPLPEPAFVGSIANPHSNLGAKAADAVGRGSVRVSPLDMALAAGVVDSGTWLAPTLVPQPGRKPAARVTFSGHVISRLKQLMQATVTSGAARAAYRPGAAIYGQVGSVQLAGHRKLYANWFVGFRGNVSFAVLVISRLSGPAGLDQASSIAGQFASTLPPGSFGRG
jgi:cell division protein FtsI/penicillin-binding protein 2